MFSRDLTNSILGGLSTTRVQTCCETLLLLYESLQGPNMPVVMVINFKSLLELRSFNVLLSLYLGLSMKSVINIVTLWNVRT